MKINRVVPDLTALDIEAAKRFYTEFVGLELKMDLGWVATLASRQHPSAQLTLVAPLGAAKIQPEISIEVEDAAALHARAVDEHLDIVYPLTDEPWGVRRFFVRDPNGHIVNFVSHVAR